MQGITSDLERGRRDARPWRQRFQAALAVLVLTILPLRSAGEEGLTPQERARLSTRCAESHRKMSDLVRQGRFAEARPFAEEALAAVRKLYPKDEYPAKQAEVGTCLFNLGALWKAGGDNRKAATCFTEAVAAYRIAYARGKFPAGHPQLANCLCQLGRALGREGEAGKAVPLVEEALRSYEALYPREKFPSGHRDLALCLSGLGALLEQVGDLPRAVRFTERAVGMAEALYPPAKYPRGHPDLAACLSDLGILYLAAGQYPQAQDRFDRALAMHEALYPRGHANTVRCLSGMVHLYQAQGDYRRAFPLAERALTLCRRLYPKERFPNGHADLILALSNVGMLHSRAGRYVEARTHLMEAVTLARALHPRERYPQGHPAVATCLENLGTLERASGQPRRALLLLQEVLALRTGLYSEEHYPQGHAELANSLAAVGSLSFDLGEHVKGLRMLERCLAMQKRLYPRESYPNGHPAVARTLAYLGALYQLRTRPHAARDRLQKALRMYDRLAEEFVDGASEAEALNYLASLPVLRHGYLALPHEALNTPPDEVYGPLWSGKATIARALERRRRSLALAPDAATRALTQEWLNVRRQLARALLAPGRIGKAGREHLQALGARKEVLERRLAMRPVREAKPRDGSPAELARLLPAEDVFIDLYAYPRVNQALPRGGPVARRIIRYYAAFVLRRGQPPQRVELGPAAPIERAVSEWRKAIVANHPGTAGASLRRLVWEPLARAIPARTRTVYVCPEGAFHRLPWGALPGKDEGSILLEEHAFAIVPHGAFLLQHLRVPRKPAPKGFVLALGGVAYDEAAPALPGADRLVHRDSPPGDRRLTWPDLPATNRELEQIPGLAGERTIHRLRGNSAGVARVLADLPRARWAHLATHGFFADAGVRSALQVDESQFEHPVLERTTVGARNPLVLSGLVLAGANRRGAKDAGGILTAEEIAGLPLDGLELAVLSACDTGLGEEAGGEGVFGLQRAFHLAGTRDVVASLWKVDDEATAALMALFYHKLWREKKAPLTALREAQLTLYRNPERIGPLAKERGLKLDKVVSLPAAPPRAGASRGPIKAWAGFILSGPGR